MIATKSMIETDSDYSKLVKLLSKYSEASNALSAIQNAANIDLMERLRAEVPAFAKHQQTLGECEVELELICRRHPEWFSDRKSMKTPFGETKLTCASHLEADNEELSCLLIQQAATKNEEGIDVTALLRVKVSLNLEALEALPDSVLRRFKIRRCSDDKFTVKPAKLDMGKAVKALEKVGQE